MNAVVNTLQHVSIFYPKMAEWTGLEPATPGVTGRYSNQLNYHSAVVLKFELCSPGLQPPVPITMKVFGVPKGIRTPVTTVKGSCPRPLDDGDLVFPFHSTTPPVLVEVSGIEPLTSCMPCKRSPS